MTEELRLSTSVTVTKYRELEKAKDRNGLADFVYERLSERYIVPVNSGAKNGFAMMACACLLIETLECFYNGWKTSDGVGSGETVFKGFFGRSKRLADFEPEAKSFYECVRSGILHQGETKCGWRINRKKGAPVLDANTKTIQATKFLNRLDACLCDYRALLKEAHWKSEDWRNFRRKMNAIIKNSEVKP